MKTRFKTWMLLAAVGLIFLHNAPTVYAQISVTQGFFPYQNFSKPAAGLNNAKIQSKAVTISAAFPLIFSEGRTVLINQVYYQRRDFSYKGFPVGGNPSINDIHDLNYTLTLQHGLSEKWALLAVVTPGLASDFEASLSADDFNFQAVTAFIRQFSPKFSFGFGAVYSTQFGKPIPLPVLAINWNNGKNLRWDTILPVSSELWYAPTPKLDLGLTLGLNGNNYHGDPTLYGVADPQLRYAVLTVGPSVSYKLFKLLSLKVDGGLIGVHQFKFFNGNTEQASYNLKPSGFFKVGLAFGG